ncbi:DUF3600 domain-containing protein [Alkalihalophilus lindianensis]|uniref:DUF3600 domain-containing protein n=1 Tax=Alkalihalophilus lindianensis TaxID=1630542 RepID=A0ABU3X866_9BACI|nr:DUF3600 domain-containing protein [Alkalihalophilus lindianensis]MDV2684075.1 DUF3600 domain-containing protein [Alkalihalophilus lindianensis]
MSQITIVKSGKSFEARLAGAILAALLLLPTSAFAFQTMFADELYGSFDDVKQKISYATMEQYLILNAKLEQAKGDLGKEDFEEFKSHLKVITAAKLEYGDPHGNIDYNQIPNEAVEKLEHTLMIIQPYFDQLNNLPSSKDVLSEAEYRDYVDALMSYEKILVQSGIDPSKGFSVETEVLPHLQAEFYEARTVLDYVNEKQSSHQ